jgi:diadenylate cyclase
MVLIHQIWSVFLVPAIDILLIAFVFYRLLLMIKGTHAMQVVIGLAVLMLVTLIMRDWMRLPTTRWLLDNFWGSAVVILAVVFQPELRGAIAQLGTRPLGRIFMPNPATVANEIIEAVREAAERQMGMLIVLEQDVGLRNYADTGTSINGEVSKELLLAIFHYRSPLHDGAVIIQHGRLVAAGCLLPLSNDPSLAKILGTRHRAAVGLSEFTDAWIIVVSEETGAISLARNGQLERDLKLIDLQQMLTSLFQIRTQKMKDLSLK